MPSCDERVSRVALCAKRPRQSCIAELHSAQGSRRKRLGRERAAALRRSGGQAGRPGRLAVGPERRCLVPLLWPEELVTQATPTRRTLLRTAALVTTALAAPLVRVARAAGNAAPGGSMVLAWHTNIAPRWLDPQQ